MQHSFEATGLWKRTLAERQEDDRAQPRARLREAFLKMRTNAAQLVSLIHADCKGLTVHDVTHLDALWEMADRIAGNELEMNPVEAFGFGASVLIHDAGMSVASYPGGLAEIYKTTEWQDTCHSALRQRRLPTKPSLVLEDIPEEIRSRVVFQVLRALHARHAQDLPFAKWTVPNTDESVHLIADVELRLSYGQRIGKIAHSHHWNLEQVLEELRADFGAEADLPIDWTLNEVKVACLLRCADASHIDSRRAPSFLYALSRPGGDSDLHWNFQNKLNKPASKGDTLVYSSSRDFEVDESRSWWLCFDVIQMIDKELSSSDALLQDMGFGRFAARRIAGAENPRALAKYIRPNKWRPIDAAIRVSDPVHLATTLGGPNLYGGDTLAPIRELIQNSIDAIRARRRYENYPNSWGQIQITLEEIKEGSEKGIWLHVDDTGIGMSERVLAGPLLDFGRSLWNSPLLQEEFPGLESRGINPIGKFGIGFFSVFLLGKQVKVISRR